MLDIYIAKKAAELPSLQNLRIWVKVRQPACGLVRVWVVLEGAGRLPLWHVEA